MVVVSLQEILLLNIIIKENMSMYRPQKWWKKSNCVLSLIKKVICIYFYIYTKIFDIFIWLSYKGQGKVNLCAMVQDVHWRAVLFTTT